MRFFNFFLNHMVQKYQNEIPPIFYYGISTKTSEKDLKIPNLQALTLGRIIKITLYLTIINALPVKKKMKKAFSENHSFTRFNLPIKYT